MCRRKTLAPKELQVEGAKPSGGSSQTCGCAAKRQFRKLQVRGSNPCDDFRFPGPNVPSELDDASPHSHYLSSWRRQNTSMRPGRMYRIGNSIYTPRLRIGWRKEIRIAPTDRQGPRSIRRLPNRITASSRSASTRGWWSVASQYVP